MSSAEFAIPVIEEPSFEIVRPNFVQRGIWSLQSSFGIDIKENQEEYYAGRFSEAISIYRRKVTEFKGTVESLKETYEKMTSALIDLEKRKREATQFLSERYVLDPHRLWLGTDQENPEPLKFSAEEIEPAIDKLRSDLEVICSTDPAEFERDYHTSSRDYITTGESVLTDLEKRLLEITEAKVDLQTADQSLRTLRDRRKTIYDLYLSSLGHFRTYENFIVILEIDGQARAQIIRAAVQSNKLELGANCLLQMYDSLSRAERTAAGELTALIDPNPILELEAKNQPAQLEVISRTEVEKTR